MPLLPTELVEKVLDKLTESYTNDPVALWTYCRHLSAWQKRCIEQHFQDFWLPKLRVVLYETCDRYDFKLSHVIPKPESKIHPRARFEAEDRLAVDNGSGFSKLLRLLWAHETKGSRAYPIFVYLGGGWLDENECIPAAYAINDSGLHGYLRREDETGFTFNWMRTINAMLREEAVMRRKRRKMLTRLSKDFNAQTRDSLTLANRIRMLSMEIQMGARVEVQKHRARRQNPTGRRQPFFHELSQRYHHQTPNVPIPEFQLHASPGQRMIPPDIYEILAQEESVIPMIDDWLPSNKAELHGAFVEEFFWRCVRCGALDASDGTGAVARRQRFQCHVDSILPGGSSLWSQFYVHDLFLEKVERGQAGFSHALSIML